MQRLRIPLVIFVQTSMAQLITPWPPPPLPVNREGVYDKMTFPECDCTCCTVEPCPCLGAGNMCSENLLCFTDKRPECHNWAGQNTEVKYCNVDRTWNLWKSVNPYDVRFMRENTWYEHDTFCRDFCMPRPGSAATKAGDACDPVPLNTPPPTKKPCPAICACPPKKKTTTAPPPAGASLLQETEASASLPEDDQAQRQTSLLSKQNKTKTKLRGQQSHLMSDAELAEQCQDCECENDNSNQLEWPYHF